MKQTAILIRNLKRFWISLLITLTAGMSAIAPVRAKTPQRNNDNAATAGGEMNSLSGALQQSGDLAGVNTGETRLGAIQQTQLVASDAQRQAEFGWSVAISGNTAVIGARNDDPDLGSGLIFLFCVRFLFYLLQIVSHKLFNSLMKYCHQGF